MGLFKKIKDIFYDEEIVEVPVKEEKKGKEEPPKPVIQEITPKDSIKTFRSNEVDEKINTFSERELFKTEKTFDFPVFEEEDEPIRTRSKTNILELQKELEERVSYSPRREDVPKNVPESKPSTFRPSPVISPIYGILDKNYKKEEIVEKKSTEKQPYSGEMSYDYVRRKAYGTLEDELEDTLTRVNSEIAQSVDELEKEIEELPKPTKNIEDLLSEIEKNVSNVSIGELEEKAKDKMMEEEELEIKEELEEDIPKFVKKEETEEKDVNDNTLEHDLFNLIDSMYEDKEE